MLKQYINTTDGGSFFYTDFSDLAYRPLFLDSAFYKVIYCKSGTASIKIDNENFILKTNEVLFCKPLQSVSVLNSDKGNVYAVAFNKTFYSLQDNKEEQSFFAFLFYSSKELVKLNLTPDEALGFTVIFDCFQNEFNYDDGVCKEMLRYALRRLFIKANAKLKTDNDFSASQQKQLKPITNYRKLVEKHFKEKHKVLQYAALLAKSPKTLANIFKNYDVKSPSRLPRQRLVFEAKRLLLSTEKTSEEIGYELGYHYTGHFSSFFKSEVGISPLDYRNTYMSKKIMN